MRVTPELKLVMPEAAYVVVTIDRGFPNAGSRTGIGLQTTAGSRMGSQVGGGWTSRAELPYTD